MSGKRKSKGRRRGGGKRSRELQSPAPPAPRPRRQGGPKSGDAEREERQPGNRSFDESWLPEAWEESRSGARAGRGFRFQDVVGAWLASQLATGELNADCLVPEELDDLHVERSEPVQIEVKSRQLRLGPFPTSRGAMVLFDSLVRHWKRFGATRKLKIVLEQGLVGLDAQSDEGIRTLPLTEVLAAVPSLGKAIGRRIERGELSVVEIETIAPLTEVIIGTWDDFLQDTERHIRQLVALPPAALGSVSLSIRSLVADAADANADPKYEHRVRLDRTVVIDRINQTAALLDIDSIEVALERGICSLIERTPLAIGDAYYEGVSTQPGHVAAGLVVPRPDLTEKVLHGLRADQAVLLTGPSGVGKSAAMWTLPSALPGVVWFRLHRVSDADLADVERLVRAYATSSRWSVGLLADAVGRGEFAAWSRLRQRIAGIPGALLVGTARREDLFTLGELADCHLVTVALDELAADIIHAGLLRRGATSVPHWQEAFEQSDGLTMEFTYLLTRGARLRDVVADQVADRVHQGRELELQVLALASTADRWSASVPTHELQDELGVDAFELKAAMARLVQEHLVVDRGGSVSGVHQVRSRAVSEVIHEQPPPLLTDTVADVLKMLRVDQLSRFVYEALREAPELETAVLAVLEDMAGQDIERLLAGLRALEMVDFHRQASAWAEIAERHEVPPAHRLLVLEFATAGLDFPEVFPASLVAATEEIRELPVQSCLRDTLLRATGLQGIADALKAATNSAECARLLRAARSTTLDCTPLMESLSRPTSLAGVLENCETAELSECVAAARSVSAHLAKAVVDVSGGVEAVMQRIRMDDPWIRELKIERVDGQLTGVARYLYISSEEQGDAHDRSVALGRQLLRLLPSIEKVDVKPIGPGGLVLMSDGHEFASSGLLRQYDYDSSAVAWNRQRFQLAQSLLGVSETERLSELARLLDETATLCLEYGTEFVRPSGRFSETERLNERRLRLDSRARQIPPPLRADPFGESSNRWLDGDLSVFITNITDKSLPRLHQREHWIGLSSWLNDTVLGENMERCRALEWRLIGRDSPPDALDEISETLDAIDAVLREVIADRANTSAILNVARRGIPKNALARAAEAARTIARERIERRRAQIEADLRLVVEDVEVHWFEGDRRKSLSANFAVGVPVSSLVEWNAALQPLLGEIEMLRKPGETPVIVPILGGKTVWSLAQQLVQQLLPVTEPSELQQLFPKPLEERLTAQIIRCHSALQVLSALSILVIDGEIDTRLRPVVERSRHDFAASSGSILELGGDAVILETAEWVRGVAERVNAEWEGQAEPGEYSANVWSGAVADPSAESGTLDVVLALSLEWDAKPEGALALLKAMTQ